MKYGWLLCLLGVAVVYGQTAPGPKPVMAEEVFKNVQVLKGVPVNQFMGTMGIFSAALGLSCEDCHTASDTGWDAYAVDTNPKKRTARRMVTMMTEINRANFEGKPVVTCYTCHKGHAIPEDIPSMPAPPVKKEEAASKVALPAVDQVLAKYVTALGGEQAMRKVTTRVITGTQDIPTGPGGTIPTPPASGNDGLRTLSSC